MPWLETAPVEERARFIDDHRLGLYDMTELCARYAISRKTGYKWLARYDAGGRPALQDRSRAPHHCPHKIAAPVAALLVRGASPAPGLGPGEARCSGSRRAIPTSRGPPSAPPAISSPDTGSCRSGGAGDRCITPASSRR